MKKNRLLLALFCSALLPLALHAGPPLICHPYEIGVAKSLPAGDVHGTNPAYDRTSLVDETLALLTPETPIMVRMETLRRSAIYATGQMRVWKGEPYTSEDRRLAAAVVEKLRERTQQAKTDRTRALALFDLGFFAETLRQTELDPALDGYALLLKASELRGPDPEVQFALALATVRAKDQKHAQHLAQAQAGAQSGTLLATNLRTHFER